MGTHLIFGKLSVLVFVQFEKNSRGTREFFGDKLDRALDTIKAGQTIQRNLMPADLVGTVMWLVSDDSGFVTGQTIAVDGGTVML